jgi:hypothetical protein
VLSKMAGTGMFVILQQPYMKISAKVFLTTDATLVESSRKRPEALPRAKAARRMPKRVIRANTTRASMATKPMSAAQ